MAANRRPVPLRRRRLIRMSEQLIRYLSVGVINTLVGLSIIWGLMLLGVDPVTANACGYAVGLVVAFILNRAWTFRVEAEFGQIVRYLLAFMVAYGINVVILNFCLQLFGGQGFLEQLPAMAAYTLSFYLLCKYYVFRA